MTSIDNRKKFRIGVLLVNYRQWDLTRSCIDSLLASDGVDITIGLIDNNSPGDVPEWVENSEKILFHRNDINLGLTSGNNTAFELVCRKNVEYVLILNNDTEVDPDALMLLAEHLENNPDTGIAAPAIPFAESPDTIWSAGGKFFRWRMSLIQIYNSVKDLPARPVEMKQVTGCAIMMRSNDYRRAGLQDPDLFVYSEDTDLCFRVTEMGMRIYLIPDAIVLHHVSVSVGGVYSPFAVYFTHRNRYIVASRYLKVYTFILFNIYYIFITFYKTIAYPLRKQGYLVPWMWLGFMHGVRNRPQERPDKLFGQVST